MPDDPSAYGSYLNFFLPQNARVPGMPSGPPGLYDMLGNMGMGGSQPGTPQEQRKRQQQQLAMAQQGLTMMQPQQMPAMPTDVSMPQQRQAAPMPPSPQVMPAGYPPMARPRPRPLPPPYPFQR